MLSPNFRRFLIYIFSIIISQQISAKHSHDMYTLTLSIMSYTKWNTAKPIFCILEDHIATAAFQKYSNQEKQPYIITPITESNIAETHCDALFLTNQTPKELQNNILSSNFKPFRLSITTNNNECEGEVIFCLYKRKNTYSFSVNLDALSKSKLHIDPRVLLLAKNMESIQ